MTHHSETYPVELNNSSKLRANSTITVSSYFTICSKRRNTLHFYIFLRFVDRVSWYNLVNKANLVHNFSYYVYTIFLHVSGNYVAIIRRNNCTYATLGICHSVWMTKCRIDTIIFPDDGHIVARNMHRIEINPLRKIVHQFGFIYNALHLLYPANEGTTILRTVVK